MLTIVEEVHERDTPETEEREGWDRFGFLPFEEGCHFVGGAIEPVTNFNDVFKWLRENVYYPSLVARPAERFEHGILFPPMAWRQERHPTNGSVRTIGGSYRPAEMYRVPVSHYIRLDAVSDVQNAREGATAFVTKVFGFIHDAPVQFWDWWFDGAASIGRHDLFIPPAVLEDFIAHAYATWRTWPAEAQELMISLLKLHGHAPGYRWDSERFSWEYIVTDACYRIADLVWPGRFRVDGKPDGKNPPHGTRIKLMAMEFGLRFEAKEAAWVKWLVRLRNNLVHEARWPSALDEDDSYRAPGFLHKMNQRLIVALLAYHNDFLSSAWLTLSRPSFGLRK